MRAQFFIPVLAAVFLVFGAGSVRADASREDGQRLTAHK